MKYLLDTNIVAYCINKKPIEVLTRLHQVPWSEICLSTIVIAELWHGVAKSQHIEKNRAALKNFLEPFQIVNFDTRAAEFYGLVRADLERQGSIIGSNDLLISAHALSLNLTLVTNNVREFERVGGLKIENWIAND